MHFKEWLLYANVVRCCLVKCDPKNTTSQLSRTSCETNIVLNISEQFSNVCLKCDPGLITMVIFRLETFVYHLKGRMNIFVLVKINFH